MGNTLTLIAKGNANPEDFMQGIEAMAQELVKAYPFLSEKDKELFKEEKPVIGKCPRCGSPVHESKKTIIALTGTAPLPCGRMTVF